MASFSTKVDNFKKFRLGTKKRDTDGNEYIYLQGVSGIVVNDWVFYTTGGAAVRAITSNILGPMAIAQQVIDASHFGWFCIRSARILGNCENSTFADGSVPYISDTAGLVNDDSGSSLVPGSSNYFQIDNPFCFSDAIV